jgi:hypothetical protein
MGETRMHIDDVPNLSDTDLEAALVDWQRWRSRVCHAPVMRLRQERFEQANAFIAAIEEELALRSPEGRYRRYRQAVTAVQELESEVTVSLAAYRAARHDLETVLSRVQR